MSAPEADPLLINFKQQGEYLNAYLVAAGTHQLLLGSLRVSLVENHPRLLDVWKIALADAVTSVAKKQMRRLKTQGVRTIEAHDAERG